jgi:hypothetical protein
MTFAVDVLRLAPVRWAVALLCALYACTPPQRPSVGPSGPTSCETMCESLARLGCEASRPTARGATCEERCREQLASGVVDPPIACLSSAASVRDVERCGERCTL